MPNEIRPGPDERLDWEPPQPPAKSKGRHRRPAPSLDLQRSIRRASWWPWVSLACSLIPYLVHAGFWVAKGGTYRSGLFFTSDPALLFPSKDELALYGLMYGQLIGGFVAFIIAVVDLCKGAISRRLTWIAFLVSILSLAICPFAPDWAWRRR
jgi:hypothetical protein